ncbi:MAG: pentapeptide repeat-containing protein, partial [Nitratireductor sp.]
ARVEAYRSSFQKVVAKGASFASAELQRAAFDGADLSYASFEKADLSRASFDEAVLSGASFAYANLSRADLSKASVAGTIGLDRAFMLLTRIEGLDLSRATGLDQSQIDMACGDAKTRLPEGLAAPASWPCPRD